MYDPLLEWTRKGGCGDQARDHLKRVEERLTGILANKKKNTPQSQPLSVEGQINHLITEATDLNNLVRSNH